MANSQQFSRPSYHALLIILFSFFILFCLFSDLNQIPKPHFLKTPENQFKSKWINYKLSEAASRIAQNNTLIVCTVSSPFLPLLNNWLISITRQNHQNKVLVIAEDYQTLFTVNKNWPGHAVLLSPPLNNTSQTGNDFGSQGFYNLTSRRPQYLLQILELGYNVMFNDVDMVWLADPFPYMVQEHDVYITDDYSMVKPLNHSHDLPNGDIYICGCMIYMVPSFGSKLLMKKWAAEITAEPWVEGTNINDQPPFNRALKKTIGQVNVYLLQQTAFPNGELYFMNEKWVEENKGMQVIIHNNYILGLKNKIERFKNYGFWFVDDHSLKSPLQLHINITF